jgi:hypothetical protein
VKLIVLRGASGAGKSTVARALRARLGSGIALVEQDYVGRVVLGRSLTDDGTNAPLLDALVRTALPAAPAVLLEGILSTERYGDVLLGLRATPGLESWFYRFDVPFEITVERHAGRGKAGSFGETELRRWWRPADPLVDADGRVLDRSITAAETVETVVERIIADTGLTAGTDPL